MLVMNNEESKSLFLQKFKDIGCHKAIGSHHSCYMHSGCRHEFEFVSSMSSFSIIFCFICSLNLTLKFPEVIHK